MDKFVEKFIEWKYYDVTAMTIILGSFVMYWFSVSGMYLFSVKVLLLILPTVIHVGKRIIKYIIFEHKRRVEQKRLIVEIQLRRLLDKIA